MTTENRSPLTTAERALIERATKLLVAIQNPRYISRAQSEGYSAAEHKLGWSLVQTAGGGDQPFGHHLAIEDAMMVDTELHGDRLALFQEIDAFENTWFPRTRAIIERVVPADRREAFAAAFFHELAQQPLGPTVVTSVTTFVSRIEGLETAKDADAKKVRKVLIERGLTTARVSAMEKLLHRATEFGKVKTLQAPSPEELAAAAAKQRSALEQLRGWLNDWSATFRTIFSVREQVNMGLTKLKRAGKEEVVVDEEEIDDAPVTPVAPVAVPA